MGGEWRTSCWGDEVTLEYGKAIRGYSQSQGKYRVFGSNGPIGWTTDALTQGPGVVLGRKGAYRGVEFCREPFWVIDTAYYLRPKTDFDMRWLYYAVKHYRLGEVDDGSPIPSTTRSAVYMLDLDVPPKHEQKKVSNILGTLDDKIELNRKQNETLEAMTRAIFKAWFVDFEPVRAKMEGRWQRGQSLPGLPADLYDLFPDRLVETELGEVPVGWDELSLDAIAKYTNGLALQKYPAESDDEFLPVIKIAQLRAGNADGADRASARIGPEYVVDDGDVLFSWSGSLEVEVWCGGRGALNQHLFKVTSNTVPKWFYFFATRQHLHDFRAIAAGKATTMGHIQRKHLTDARVVVPPSGALEKFDAEIGPLFHMTISNALQSRTLTHLRNTLLPKLISGELRIPDAERIVGAAA